MGRPKKSDDTPKTRRPPATTPEAREDQLVAMAVDLAEKQLLEGTASSQVITHYLKIGTTRELLEKEKLAHENELLKAKTESMASAAKIEQLYMQAMEAFTTYRGGDDAEEEYEG